MSATKTTTTPDASTAQRGVRPDRPANHAKRALVTTAVLLFLLAVVTIDAAWGNFLGGISELFGVIPRMFFPPDWGTPPGDWGYFPRALSAMLESVQIAWFGTVIGAFFSLPLALLAAKNVTGRGASTGSRQVLNSFRAFPELVLAIIFVPMVGLGPVGGALAIGIHSIGTLGKLGSEAVEGIDPGPLEAADAVGATWLQKMRWAVLPQSLPEIVAFWLYRFEINIRASAILGVVGAGGIGSVLANTVTYRRWDKAGAAIIVVIVVTLLIDAISGRIRQRLIQGKAVDPAVAADAAA